LTARIQGATMFGTVLRQPTCAQSRLNWRDCFRVWKKLN
jgi:hypothetical protein